jgi:putative ABC transport system permease protein
MRDWNRYVRERLRLRGIENRREEKIVRELAAQVEEFYLEAVAGGASDDEALRHAEQRTGNWESLAHDLGSIERPDRIRAGDMNLPTMRDRWAMIADLLPTRDLRLSIRSLLGRPGYTLVVAATLALGIGATTAVFSVIDAVLLSPLPYGEPERLVRLYQADLDEAGALGYLTLPAFIHFRSEARSLDGIAALYNYRAQGADLTTAERAERIRILRVGADYFPVLRVQPVAGRHFSREEERKDARVAVISGSLWRRCFGGGTLLHGQDLILDGEKFSVIGIMPDGYEDPLEGAIDAWLPADLPTGGWPEWEWDNHHLSAIARLRPGVPLETAQQEIDLLSQRQWKLSRYATNSTGRLVPLQADLVGSAETTLYVLMGAVALLLLIACVNVASLALARGTARGQELAICAALGASPRRLVSGLLTESLVLALAGGAGGILLAIALSRALTAAAPVDLLRGQPPPFDSSVFGFGLGAAAVAGMLFGVAPALRFSRPDLSDLLSEGGRGGSHSRRTVRLRNLLVVVEVSLALVLLIGAGILTRSFAQLEHVNLNLKSESVVTFEVHLPDSRYGEPASRTRFHQEFHRRLSSLPGVRAVGAVSRLPLTGRYHSWGTRRALAEGVPMDEANIQADQRVVEGAYFSALGIPVLRGRVFGPEDNAGAPRRIVVNHALVRALYGKEDPVGRMLRIAGSYSVIIGVVADVPVTARGAVVPMVFHSHPQFADDRNWPLAQVVSVDRLRPNIIEDARRELMTMDRALVLYTPKPLDEVIGRGRSRERFAMLLIGTFAALALSLAAIGIYGVLAHSVSRRQREIGIRMALGARAASVKSMVVRQGMALAGIGILLGLLGAAGLTRWLATLVFEVSVLDPWALAAAAAILALVALAASYLPAREATRLSAVDSLRRE